MVILADKMRQFCGGDSLLDDIYLGRGQYWASLSISVASKYHIVSTHHRHSIFANTSKGGETGGRKEKEKEVRNGGRGIKGGKEKEKKWKEKDSSLLLS